MVTKLLGFYEGKSKKENKPFCVAKVAHDATPAENARGNYGLVIDEIFLPDNLIGSLSVTDCGKEVDITYTVSGRYANVTDFKVKK